MGSSLVIYKDNKVCRKTHSAFNLDSKAIDFTSGFNAVKFPGTLLGLALSNKLYPQDTKSLYFRPLASFSLMSTPADHLQCNSNENLTKIDKNIDVLPSQAIAMAFSSQNTLFFGRTNENAIGCWNKYQPLITQNVVSNFL